MSICPVCMKRPCDCRLMASEKFIKAMETAVSGLAAEDHSAQEDDQHIKNNFVDEMGNPFYPVEKIDIAIMGKTISAKTFDEAANILSSESGNAIINISWKNDMSIKVDMLLDGDRTRVEPFLIQQLEEIAGFRTPEGMSILDYTRRIERDPSCAQSIALGILGVCDTGLKSNRSLEDPAFAIDLDTGGIVLSGERGLVNIKALRLVAAGKSEDVIAMLEQYGLPDPKINIGILYGPFTPIEICKINEVSGFASVLYKERYQSIPEMK